MKQSLAKLFLISAFGIFSSQLCSAANYLQKVYAIKEIFDEAEHIWQDRKKSRHPFKHLIHHTEDLARHAKDDVDYEEALMWTRNLLHFLEDLDVSTSTLPKKHLSKWLYWKTQISNGFGLAFKAGIPFAISALSLYISNQAQECNKEEQLPMLIGSLTICIISGVLGVKAAKNKVHDITLFQKTFEIINNHFEKHSAHEVEHLRKYEL